MAERVCADPGRMSVAVEDPTIRIVSVPADHPYVRALSDHEQLRLLPDPPVPGGAPGQWWPPAALDPDWIRRHRDDVDLLHIHFGTESFDAQWLVDSIDAAHDVGWSVVQTVHDIDNPQLTTQSRHHDQLARMLPEVDAVVTLTPGAAAAIAERWATNAIVIAHPRLLAEIPPAHPRSDDTAVVGMYLNDLRPNVDAIGATIRLLAAVRMLRSEGAQIRGLIHMHRRVRDESDAATIRSIARESDDLVLIEMDRPDDETLAVSLNGIDVCVLPYSFGTHSGWLELCWDLGVPVAVPDLGYYAEQHGDASVASFAQGSSTSLADVLRGFLTASSADVTAAGTRARRNLQDARRRVRDVADRRSVLQHAQLYRRLRAARDSR